MDLRNNNSKKQELFQTISELIDYDHWKHSWHINAYKAEEKSINAKLKKIIEDKISKRKKEISELEKGLIILNEFKIKEDVIINDTVEEIEDLPW